MLRNDYRRALIMLRGLTEGVSGYVRLERRTLIGTLQFTINGAPQDAALYALMLYVQNGLWYACKLDKLGAARGGQAGMVYRFDPRNICGRDLEQYSLVVVAGVENGACELLLAGYLNSPVETDWPQARQAVCQALASESGSAASLPTTGALSAPVPQIALSAERAIPAAEKTEPALQTPESIDEDTFDQPAGPETSEEAGAPEPDEFDRPAAGSDASREKPAPDEFDHPAASLETAREKPAPQPDEFDSPAASAEPEEGAQADATPESSGTAGDALALDVSLPWPDSVEPLRQLFRTRAASRPFEAEGFALIKAPVASEAGFDHCVVGISAGQGRPDRVLYGIPARYTPTPPAGLEGYEWRGDGRNGYWVIVRPVE